MINYVNDLTLKFYSFTPVPGAEWQAKKDPRRSMPGAGPCSEITALEEKRYLA
jgi:hypothetical protein